MRIEELDYELPEHLIAQTPAERREAARLLVFRMQSDTVEHCHVADLPDLLRPTDLLILNDTRVLPARFYGTRKRTGGHIEGLYLSSTGERQWHIMLKAGGKPTPGEWICLDAHHEIQLGSKQEDGSWIGELHGPLATEPLLEKIGVMPLPPYIRRDRTDQQQHAVLDRDRYQTVYADQSGAVAAPTAGLHLTNELLAQLQANQIDHIKVTLHVGAGTFAPVRSETLEEHPMHSERFRVSAATLARIFANRSAADRRTIAVGTTSVRTIESLPDSLGSDQDYAGETDLLIQPPYPFRFTDGLLTNFHLPRSTLLALVGALTGLDRLKELYAESIAQEYRFYSYGDAMLILPE